jgi:hypothetical protein
MTAEGTVKLRRIAKAQLPAGQKLPGHLRDRGGRVMFRAGVELTPALLDRLADGWFTVGPDWPVDPPRRNTRAGQRPAADGNSVVAPVTGSASDRRTQRHTCRTPIDVYIREPGISTQTLRKLSVETVDLSKTGFAFLFNQYIPVGKEVVAEFIGASDRPRLNGIVRNCVHLHGKTHRIGVEFVARK